MTRKEIVDKLVEVVPELTKVQANMVLQELPEIIKGSLKEPGDDVYLGGIFRAFVKKVPARTRRNPRTGSMVQKPETTTIKLKNFLNK